MYFEKTLNIIEFWSCKNRVHNFYFEVKNSFEILMQKLGKSHSNISYKTQMEKVQNKYKFSKHVLTSIALS